MIDKKHILLLEATITEKDTESWNNNEYMDSMMEGLLLCERCKNRGRKLADEEPRLIVMQENKNKKRTV